MNIHLQPIGYVRSDLVDVAAAPRQGGEGAPDAWLDILPEFVEALQGLTVATEIIVLTWLHRARRTQLMVHPRNEPSAPMTGVFATRSPHRPNAIGLHRTRILAIDAGALRVKAMEAIDGTPIIDIKVALEHY